MSPWPVGHQNIGFLVSGPFSNHRHGDKFEQNLKRQIDPYAAKKKGAALGIRKVMNEGGDVI